MTEPEPKKNPFLDKWLEGLLKSQKVATEQAEKIREIRMAAERKQQNEAGWKNIFGIIAGIAFGYWFDSAAAGIFMWAALVVLKR
jgi:hypothetical protein